MAPLELTHPDLLPEGSRTLSVDGMLPAGPNLSHWPGNRTPARWKADLSTGICLNFAQAPGKERQEFLGDARFAVNDHYDTDGFLSLLTVLRPDLALAHQELLLAAAATGDYQAFQTPRGFAIDRTVLGLAKQDSPVADAFEGLSGAAKDLGRYRWLIDNAERVLLDTTSFAPLYEAELRAVTDEIDAMRTGAADRRFVHSAQLAVVTTPGPIHRMTLNSIARGHRVLHVIAGDDGTRFRYHDRTESWFEVATFTAPPRVDLRPLAAALQELEGDPEGSRWAADAPDQPVPELYFGVPSEQAYGAVTRELTPSRLPTEKVVAAVTEHLAIREF